MIHCDKPEVFLKFRFTLICGGGLSSDVIFDKLKFRELHDA